MEITVKMGVGPDLSMYKHEDMLRNVWRRYPYLFDTLEIIETNRSNRVIERPEPETLKQKMQATRRQIGRLQMDCNDKGYSIDFESILIGIEGHIETLNKYEELDGQTNQ